MDDAHLTPPSFTYAGFWRRKGAYAIDVVVVLLLYTLVVSLLGSDAHAQSAEMQQLEQNIQTLVAIGMLPPGTSVNSLLSGSTGSLFSWPDLVLPLLVSAVYNIIFLVSGWQATLGKRFCGIYVMHVDGNKLTLKQSALRHIASGLSMLPLGLGYVTMAFSKEKASLHDLMCNTRVVMGKTGVRYA